MYSASHSNGVRRAVGMTLTAGAMSRKKKSQAVSLHEMCAESDRLIMRVECPPLEGENMVNDYQEALAALHMAENHFAFAAPDYIDAAIMELNAAQKRVEAALHREKNK